MVRKATKKEEKATTPAKKEKPAPKAAAKPAVVKTAPKAPEKPAPKKEKAAMKPPAAKTATADTSGKKQRRGSSNREIIDSMQNIVKGTMSS